MWQIFKKPIVDAAVGLTNGANNIIKTFTGSKAERDQQHNERFLAGQHAFSAEFQAREHKTWIGSLWNSIWDGFNRVPRPVIVTLVLAYFYMAYKNPTEFQVLNTALDTVPERMWWVLSAIVGFYFVAREFQKSRDKKMALSSDEFKEVQNRINELRTKEDVPKNKLLPVWYTIAREEMEKGVKEIAGDDDNQRIVEYHSATSLKASDDETAWCSAFVNWCMMKANIERTDKPNARSWLDWGIELDRPVEGCVVIFKRGSQAWQGHVGFFVGFKGDQVLCLGGNQGNEVNISSYSKTRVLGYRWIKK